LTHKDIEGKNFFIEHLDYLMSLTPRQRDRREDYIYMKMVLKQQGRWKRISPPSSGADHLKKFRYK
jgi:hypothetical protein